MKVEKVKVKKYKTYPNEVTKGAGKNTKIWSDHYVTLEDGSFFYFEAEGTRQWAYIGDTVSFEWEWKVRDRDGKQFRTINWETFRAWDKSGEEIIRGIRERNKPRRGQRDNMTTQFTD